MLIGEVDAHAIAARSCGRSSVTMVPVECLESQLVDWREENSNPVEVVYYQKYSMFKQNNNSKNKDFNLCMRAVWGQYAPS